jgi:hypothetical protein
MTPPLSIGDDVEITGPDLAGKINWLGQKFKIERISGIYDNHYTANGVPLFPASSLRLVEKLKIGDWVEVIGQPKALSGKPIGGIARIESSGMNPGGDRAMGYRIKEMGYWYPATSLRKLAPEEVQAYTSPCKKEDGCGFVPIHVPTEFEKLKDRVQNVEWRAEKGDKRLSTIESRHNSLAPSHAELLGDVGALAEKVGAIEKRQREQHERMDRFMQDYREHKDFDFDMHDRIKVLEGERPEVCDEPSTYTGSPIRVSISRDGIEQLAYEGNPDVAMRYAKKALDSMREE